MCRAHDGQGTVMFPSADYQVIFLRDVTIGIRAKVLKIFLKYFGASGE